jgi:DNA-directed RNA polymerase subunit H (RpoH/RPB5)
MVEVIFPLLTTVNQEELIPLHRLESEDEIKKLTNEYRNEMYQLLQIIFPDCYEEIFNMFQKKS